MAGATRNFGAKDATNAAKNDDEWALHTAEIVEPATMEGTPGRLLTRSQVARRLGMSLSTVRRMEGEQLKPIVDERGVHYFEETEIQAVFVRVRRARAPANERADGTLAAAAFRLFQRGSDVIAVVKELREAPEVVEALFTHWKRLRGSLLLDTPSIRAIANELGGDKPKDEQALVAAVAEFKQRMGPSCVLCGQSLAHWCRACAQNAGRAELLERESRRLF